MTWTVTIAPGETGDENAINELLAEVGLKASAFDDNAHAFLVMKEGGRLIGCAALLLTQGSGLIRSLAVKPAFRRRGLGKQLIREMIDRAIRFRLTSVYLLTMDAESFFRRLGFRPKKLELAPTEIRELSQFRDECCKDATLMCFEFPDSDLPA